MITLIRLKEISGLTFFITAYLALDDIKDTNIKETTKLLTLDNLWIGDKNVDNFYHNKVSAINFLNSWESASRESEIPNIQTQTSFD